MSKKLFFRIISACMFLAGFVFLVLSFSNPALGSTIYIVSFALTAAHWRFLYAAYAIVMVALFAASFFIKGDRG